MAERVNKRSWDTKTYKLVCIQTGDPLECSLFEFDHSGDLSSLFQMTQPTNQTHKSLQLDPLILRNHYETTPTYILKFYTKIPDIPDFFTFLHTLRSAPWRKSVSHHLNFVVRTGWEVIQKQKETGRLENHKTHKVSFHLQLLNSTSHPHFHKFVSMINVFLKENFKTVSDVKMGIRGLLSFRNRKKTRIKEFRILRGTHCNILCRIRHMKFWFFVFESSQS